MKINDKIKQNKRLLSTYYVLNDIRNYFSLKLISFTLNYYKYFKDYSIVKKNEKVTILYPCTRDKTTFTPINTDYFYQNTWFAKKLIHNKPTIHYDVGSDVKMIGILSQFVKINFIDIRNPNIKLNNFKYIKGDICNLPFKTNSIKSISSLCVIEHIGLGRYGDDIDPDGSEKAIKELIRVTIKNGNIFITVPIYSENRLYFNAHRTFTRKFIMDKFKQCKLIEEQYFYNGEIVSKLPLKMNTYGTGFFWFKK